MSKEKMLGNVLKVLVSYALNLITILIPVSVLAIDLYVNVQRVRYVATVKSVKANVLPWIKPEYLPKSLSSEEFKNIRRDKRKSSYLEVAIKDMKHCFYGLKNKIFQGEEQPTESIPENNSNRTVKCSLEALKSMVDKLRAEKEKLEGLHSTMIYAFNQKLDVQAPGTVQIIYYDREEKEEFAQLASESFLLKPKKVKADELHSNICNERRYLAGLLFIIEKYKEVKNWLLYSPVEAKSLSVESLSGNNGGEISLQSNLNLDLDERYLFEEF